MPYFRTPFTINNGDIASASYLTSMVQVSSYASSALVIIGNSASSTNSPLVEITVGGNLALSTSGTINLSQNVGITGTLSVTGALQALSTVQVTGALQAFSTVAVTGALTASSTLVVTGQTTLSGGLSSALPVASGGTAATSVSAANQSLTPSTVTVTESGGAATINWASGSNFYLSLNANCTISFSNAQDGQLITVMIYNSSSYTVTWPSIKWPSASSPTQTTGGHYDVYSIVYNSTVGAYFGTYVQNY